MQETSPKAPSAFPAPIYRDTVLAHVFTDAKRYFLHPLLSIHYAHTIMLAQQRIMPANEAAACLRALDGLDLKEILGKEYDGSFEDLFFYIEKKLADACGPEVAGKMHTARSRNDIDMTMYRIVLRERLLQILDANLTLRSRLVSLASEHRASLMPAYTHNQPAQPTTLGHYLMAYVEILERDAERLLAAYERTNRSPLGACAITTTGFPIDRTFTSQRLGFKGLQVNSYGCIGAADYFVEPCATLAVAMLSLGRFAQDLLLWSTAEFNYLRLSDAYVQVSSIMPQKRNPVPLEHVRILASRSLTVAQSILGSLHNTPFGDINDAEDDLQPLVYTAFEDAHRSLALLEGALSEATFNTDRMAAAAESNFLPVTELADTLVRTTGMSFHQAHTIVSRAVKELSGRYDRDVMTDVVMRDVKAGKFRAITREQIWDSLGARNFVDVRGIPGGPAAGAVDPEIERAGQQLTNDRVSVEALKKALEAAEQLLSDETDRLIAQYR